LLTLQIFAEGYTSQEHYTEQRYYDGCGRCILCAWCD